MEGTLDIKVYYEDTDCLGMVYHANYLRFFERARTELFGEATRPLAEWNADGYLFAVYKMEIAFRRAARLGDICQVRTRFEPRRSDYRLCLKQMMTRGEELIAEASVQLVCLDPKHGVRAFPPELLAMDK